MRNESNTQRGAGRSDGLTCAPRIVEVRNIAMLPSFVPLNSTLVSKPMHIDSLSLVGERNDTLKSRC